MAKPANEFTIVTLSGYKRRCLQCVSEYHRFAGDHSLPHYSNHWRFSESGGHLPQRWRVVSEVDGDPIPIGSALRVVGARHCVFFEYGGMDSIDWLFEVVDGVQAGAIYYVFSDAGHEPNRASNNYFDVPWDAPVHPIWPKGLEPIP